MRNIIILFFLLPIYTFSQSQWNWESKELDQVELTITYLLKYQQDSMNPDFVKQEDMLLFLGKKISLFASKNSYVAMSQLNKLTTTEERQLWASNRIEFLRTKFQYRIFKNYPEGRITCTDHIMGPPYIYEEKHNAFNWQLQEDTDTIANYKVQKAICDFGGRKWIAWFSPDIPYNDGPYKFSGLPGLIVKIYDSNMHYVFEIKYVEKPEQKLMVELDERDYIKTTKEGFFQAEDYFKKDIISRIKESGGSLEYQQRATRNMAAQNNPIELKRK